LSSGQKNTPIPTWKKIIDKKEGNRSRFISERGGKKNWWAEDPEEKALGRRKKKEGKKTRWKRSRRRKFVRSA